MKVDWTNYSYSTENTTIKALHKTNIKSKDGKYFYLVECDHCSKDKELFPEDLLFTSGVIRNRQVSCGCGRNPNWSELQFNVLVKRKCEKVGFIFLGFVGKFEGNKTKVKILDPRTDQIWVSQNINKVLGKRGPKNPNLFCKSDNDFIDEIKTSDKYQKGTEFFKEDNIWFYFCPICSNDEYVKNGVCDGKFRSTRSNLRKGKKSCRCSSTYRPSQEQIDFKVNKILKGKGILLSTGDWYKTNRSKFDYLCLSCETESSMNYHDLCRGSFCRNCCKTGYSTDKPGRIYLVRRFNDNGVEFLKFGITNLKSKERINRQKSKCGLCYEILLDFYFKDGKIPLDIEDNIKSTFKTGFIDRSIFPDGFTETLSYTDLFSISDFINKYISLMEA